MLDFHKRASIASVEASNFVRQRKLGKMETYLLGRKTLLSQENWL